MKQPSKVFEDLLNVEVNTILKHNMTADKMPSLPFALLDILETYGWVLAHHVDLRAIFEPTAEELWDRIKTEERRKHDEPDYGSESQDKYDKNRDYIAEACDTHAALPGGRKLDPQKLLDRPEFNAGVYDCLRDLWPAFKPKYIGATTPKGEGWFSMDEITNGWESFERMRIAALLAQESTEAAEVDEHDVLFSRIVSSCSKIKYIIQSMQQAPPKPPESRGMFSRVRSDEPANYAAFEQLIPMTRNQLLHGRLRGKQMPLMLTSEEVALIRKIWEVGDEHVICQTAVQLDGDVLTRISAELFKPHMIDKRDLLLDAHRRSVDVGLQHWRSLVQVAIEVVTKVLGKLTR